jgi:O-methyltransferase domain
VVRAPWLDAPNAATVALSEQQTSTMGDETTGDLASRRVRPRDVIGLPLLPSGRMSAVANRLRTAIAALHLRMAPPPLRILESILGIVDHAALVALCDLGVPDALRGPTALPVLASDLGVDEAGLGTLIRFAAARRWLRVDRRGRVVPTTTTRFLAGNHPGGWRAWVDFAARPEVPGALAALSEAVRTGREAFAIANGETFFAHLTANRSIGNAFDGAMAAGGRLHGLALSASIDWSAVTHVCDVGGGNGSLLTTLLGAVPHLSGVLFDLPEVVAEARPSDRLDVVGGDAFHTVPPGCDVYLLVNVLHDWDDARAVLLLQRLATTAPPDAQVIVVEAERHHGRPLDGIHARSDVLMLALAPGGRERTANQFAELARQSGYHLQRVIPLASADRAFVLVHA